MIHAKQMSRAIGQTVLYRANGLSFQVTIKDVRTVWNRVDLLVQPVAGTGEKWVSFDSCSPLPCEPTVQVQCAYCGEEHNSEHCQNVEAIAEAVREEGA